MWLSAGKASCPLTASVVRWRWSQCVCFRQGCRSSFHQRPRSGKTLPLCKNMRLLYFSSSPLGSGSRENGWGRQSVRGSAWLGYNPYILPFIFLYVLRLHSLKSYTSRNKMQVNTCVLCESSLSVWFHFSFLSFFKHTWDTVWTGKKNFVFWTIVFFKYTQKVTLQSWREPVADWPGGPGCSSQWVWTSGDSRVSADHWPKLSSSTTRFPETWRRLTGGKNVSGEQFDYSLVLCG